MIKRILLYGNSIFLTSLAMQLQTRDDVDVCQQPLHDGPLNLSDVDAVIVDFNNVEANDVLAILRVRPTLKIVGVNAPGGAVTVFSGRVYLAQTLVDVVDCLE